LPHSNSFDFGFVKLTKTIGISNLLPKQENLKKSVCFASFNAIERFEGEALSKLNPIP